MLLGSRVAVIVPAHNEERLIGETLASVPAFVDDVVVVDDASTDRTSERALAVDDRRVVVVRHGANRGVGAAIGTGYELAFAAGAEAVAVMAGDAQMDPSDLSSLLAPALRGEADYIKGDRLSYPGARRRMPVLRWLGNHALSCLTRCVTGLSVRDSQCGYTVLSRRAALRLRLARLWPRYGYPNDLLGMVGLAGLRVREVVVRPIYGTERSGIDLRHALFVVPWVLLRVLARRLSAGATRLLSADRGWPRMEQETAVTHGRDGARPLARLPGR